MLVLIFIRALTSTLSSCNDIHDCRTVPSIIFNCASTVFLCTWVALHLDVPTNPQKAWWKKCLHRIKWVMIALVAPEFIFGKAVIEWTESCQRLKAKLSELGTAIGQNAYSSLSSQCVLLHQGKIRPAIGRKHMQCWQR